MRELTNDPRGTADWIEREARGMDPMQLYREFVQNGIEAGADRIVIDRWTDPDTGHRLARITDNGTGLTGRQLVERLSCLHGKFKGETNYGVGARIAALPSNHAGLTFASRTTTDDATLDAMMTLHKHSGKFGVKTWEVEDDDGYTVTSEIVAPDPGMLERLPDNTTGTAVILHGNGREDTWDSSVSHKVHSFLTRRYYDFGDSVKIFVEDMSSEGSTRGLQLRSVWSTGQYLAAYGTADGEIPFRDIAGLSGVMFWWIIPPAGEVARSVGTVPGGVGMVVEDEIFDYNRSYLGDFGVIYSSVQKRVAILVFVDGAEMDTARAGLILPSDNRKSIPWKRLGAYFAENMPDDIDALMSAVTVTSSSFDAEMAKMLDKDWMLKLNPVQVQVPSGEGEPSTGSDAGDAAPPGQDIEHDEHKRRKSTKRRHAAERKHHGQEPGKPKLKPATPKVVFVSREEFDNDPEHPFGITWHSAVNTIKIADDFAPYVREVGRWCEKVNHPRQVVEAAVQGAYMIEYAAHIIDANAQNKFELRPDEIDALKSDGALYAKALGMQSLTERIEGYIKDAAKNA